MTVYDAIVVGTDGSDSAGRAVQRAALYGAALTVPVVVATAYVRPSEGEVGPASQRAEMPQQTMVSSGYRAATDIAGDAASFGRQAAPDADLDPTAVEGDAAEVLIDLAARRGDALIVVGSKGMTGSSRFLLGSVPNKVSHHAPGDVLIARTDQPGDVALPARVLIGTDGSKTATWALERGLGLAAGVGAEVTVLTAGNGNRRAAKVLEDAAERGRSAGVAVATIDAPGEAADELLLAAEGQDLVIVGNKGMTGAARFLLGSVPNKVSHHIASDLLIVRTT